MRSTLVTMMLMTMIAVVQAASAADTPDQSDDLQPNRSPELQVLDQFIGTWDVEVVVEPTEGERVAYDMISRRTWSRGGGFIRFEDEHPPGEPEFHMLWTYDPNAENYPATGMHGAQRLELAGTWDEKTKTMTSRSTYPDGSQLVATHRFVSKDRAEASGTVTTPNGEVIVNLSWNQTRRKTDGE